MVLLKIPVLPVRKLASNLPSQLSEALHLFLKLQSSETEKIFIYVLPNKTYSGFAQPTFMADGRILSLCDPSAINTG